MQVVVELKDWSYLPPKGSSEREQIDSGRADVWLKSRGARYRRDFPGPNFDGVGQMHYDLIGDRGDPDDWVRHDVFVNIDDRSDVYCLACGPIDRERTVREWQSRPDRAGEPATAEPRQRVKDVELYYELHGEGAEPLVFISGTGMNCDMWRVFQVPDFGPHYRILIYDHRGIGRSSKPNMRYSTRMFADDLAALMDSLGFESAHVLGHSMGGRVAQWLALDHPNKVRSLVLSGTGPGPWPGKVDHALGVPFHTALEMVEKGFERYMKDHFNNDFMHSEEFRGTERWKRVVDVVTSHLPPAYGYLRHVVARQEHSTFDVLHRIEVPTLVIAGSKDRVPAGTGDHVAAARILAEKIPGAEFKLLEGYHHGYLREAPEVANPVILAWLASVRTRS